MIKIESDTKVWITSDTHFGHKNICRGTTEWRMPDGSIPVNQTRPFDTIEEMNEAIVNNINSCVGEDDFLIHTGDWSFGGFENVERFRSLIKCKRILLFLGNHDHHIESNKEGCQSLFVGVRDYGMVKYRGEKLVLMHYPISSWNGLRKGHIHLHGHCHLPIDIRITNGRRMDIGMDGSPEFRPYDLYNEVILPLKKLPIGSELGAADHHTEKMLGVQE